MSKFFKLYAFGDSFTDNRYSKDSWAKYLGELLNIKYVNNYGESGASIQRMFYNCVLALSTQKKTDNIFVVVGLTELNRQYVFDHKGLRGYHQDPVEHMNRFYSDMIMFQSFLELRNIEYRFFSALKPLEGSEACANAWYEKYFMKTIGPEYVNNEKIIGWPFLSRYGGFSFQDFILKKSDRIRKDDHPTSKGHKDWAEFLYKEIKL